MPASITPPPAVYLGPLLNLVSSPETASVFVGDSNGASAAVTIVKGHAWVH